MISKKEWYQQNRDHAIAYSTKWAADNPERVKEAKKRSYEKHKERYKAEKAQRYYADPEKHRNQSAEWRKNNLARYNANQARYRATKLQATPVWSETDDIIDVYKEAKYFGYHVDHIIPLNSKKVCGLHVISNLQLLPPKENISKGNRVYD